MDGFLRISLIFLVVTSAFAQGQRDGKNLRGVFPFRSLQGGAIPRGANNRHDEHHHDHGHHGHHQAHQTVDHRHSRVVGMGNEESGDVEDVDLDIGAIASAGERCVDKVVMVEETEYDDVVTCKHSYSKKCHTTYITDFEPQQEEECEETFQKTCFIEYKKVASEETVRFCHTPILLEAGGPDVCTTVTESHCQTHYHEHDVEEDTVECTIIQEEKCEDVTQGYTTAQKCTKWPVNKCTDVTPKNVKKYSPVTECKPVSREVCGEGSIQVPGEEECFDRKQTVVQEVPEETCTLEPQRTCKHVTKLVPLLKPAEECVDIPKEVCSRSRTNPQKVIKPIIKKWCYVPTEESGLAQENDQDDQKDQEDQIDRRSDY